MPNSGGLTRASLYTELLEGIIAGVMPSHVLLFRLLANAVPVSECLWAPAIPVKANSVPWSNASVGLGSISLSFRIGLISFRFYCAKDTCSIYSLEHHLSRQETLSPPKWWCLSSSSYRTLCYDKINFPLFLLIMKEAQSWQRQKI